MSTQNLAHEGMTKSLVEIEKTFTKAFKDVK